MANQINVEDVLRAHLTPDNQLPAAIDPASNVLTLACAGSGKSRTLAYRIARLLATGEDPSSIVAFTFTQKAADSIKLWVSRALHAAGLEPTILGAMFVGTIHSYCQFMLTEIDARYRQFDVLDENRLKLFLISRYGQLNLQRLRNLRAANIRYFVTIREVSDAWTTMNDEMVEIEAITALDPELGRVLQDLWVLLDEDQFIDFSLMIRLAVEALVREEPGAERTVNPVRHLMVDEYQDINTAQEALIRELRRRIATLFVVGDDDQAIYAWRGADVSNILTFQQRYPGCSSYELPFNFRSTEAIVQAADGLARAELGATRIPKNPQASNPHGPRDFRVLWFGNRPEEAEWVANRISTLIGTEYVERDGTIRGLTPGDFAILMRSTRQPEQSGDPRHAAFTTELEVRGIPYSLEAGGGVFERPHAAVLKDTFNLLRNSSPDRDIARGFFDNMVVNPFPFADFERFARVLADWGRQIHGPIDGARRRVFPQRLVHELLEAFGLSRMDLDTSIMRNIGVFSNIIQDVEAVYLSIDTTRRFQQIDNFLQNVAESGYDTSTDDVFQRPDAVTVSTVHKMKGLEFPAVFVVDVENQRFPTRRSSYSGWLPPEVIHQALQRGAYQGTRDEEARLFYTAITRAERYLYISGSQRLPDGRRDRQPSPFAQRLHHDEISDDQETLPEGLVQHPQVPRIDEAVMPTSYSDIRYYLRCPKDYQFRKSFGFSPAISEMFGYGMTVHTIVGKLHELYLEVAPSEEQADEVARETFHLKHVARSRDPENRPGAYERAQDRAVEIATDYVLIYADDFVHQRQVEVRFEIPVERAVISGSIDLILHYDENGDIVDASVIDFKSMKGGSEPEESERLHWTELSLQVQLYAKAAREVLGGHARTGAVHLLRDNQRIEVPVHDEAVDAATRNIEWAVHNIIRGDFPMRPGRDKCEACDFSLLCPKIPEEFQGNETPPEIFVPGEEGRELARAFSEFES